MSKLSLRLEGDTTIIVERRFQAPPEAVYRAHVDPTLISRWMVGPDGWSMPEYIHEAFPGGQIRYVWTNDQGERFSLTGEILELDPPHRIVHVERMHLPDPTPDNHIVTTFRADCAGTLMVMTMELPDEATRAAIIATGMSDGMEDSYARLEEQSAWGAAARLSS